MINEIEVYLYINREVMVDLLDDILDTKRLKQYYFISQENTYNGIYSSITETKQYLTSLCLILA